MKQGDGEYTFKSGKVYSGKFVNDVRDGLGTLEWKDGSKYIGPWKADQQHGIGIFVDQDGVKKTGEWQQGEFVRWITEKSIEVEEEKVIEDQSSSEGEPIEVTQTPLQEILLVEEPEPVVEEKKPEPKPVLREPKPYVPRERP